MHSNKAGMISFLKENSQYFEEAVALSVSDKQPYAWRAALIVKNCIDRNDSRITNHIDPILDCIPKKKEGHQRELIKILLKINLSEKQEGILFDICVSLWEQIDKQPSVRHTAFFFISKLASKYPDLENELSALTQPHYLEGLSPGIKRSILKWIKS